MSVFACNRCRITAQPMKLQWGVAAVPAAETVALQHRNQTANLKYTRDLISAQAPPQHVGRGTAGLGTAKSTWKVHMWR